MSQWATSRGVKAERTQWRDEALSARHRQYGFNCPALDVDFLLTEYTSGKSVAVVDYKACDAGEPAPISRANRSALCSLAASLPAFVAYYWRDPMRYVLVPLNQSAAMVVGSPCEWLTEYEWVQRLYAMRGLSIRADMPSDEREGLARVLPPTIPCVEWFGPSNPPPYHKGLVFRRVDPLHGREMEMIPVAEMPPIFYVNADGDLLEIIVPKPWQVTP